MRFLYKLPNCFNIIAGDGWMENAFTCFRTEEPGGVCRPTWV
jgi:hypothetical protein